MNLGASLFLVGLTVLILQRRLLIIIFLAIVIGFSSASQYHLANTYKQDWELLRNFFWQLSWRVPGIEPNTVILTNRPPFVYSTDNSLTAPLNWIYAPENKTRLLPLLFYDVASRYPDGWSSISTEQALQQQYRIMNFDGSLGRAISIFYKPPNCVKIMDPVVDRELPGKPLYITPGAAFSRTDLIELEPAEPATPPAALFGPEPARDWCYFFEKAELARQMGDWNTAAALADQALSTTKPMTEANVLEWLPFIEAYGRTDNWQKAENLSQQVYQVHPKMRRTLCSLWGRIANNSISNPARDQAVEHMYQLMACSIIDEE
jgi:hypothetical protein